MYIDEYNADEKLMSGTKKIMELLGNIPMLCVYETGNYFYVCDDLMCCDGAINIDVTITRNCIICNGHTLASIEELLEVITDELNNSIGDMSICDINV